MKQTKTCVTVLLSLSATVMSIFLGWVILLLPAILNMGSGFGINWSGMTLWFLFMLFALFVCPPVIYNASTLFVLQKAKKSSDVSTMRKILGFVFGAIIVGVMLCSLQDKDFPEGDGTLPAQNKNNYADLLQYKRMLDDGLISTGDYQTKKALLLK